jgi:hypothetical protein
MVGMSLMVKKHQGLSKRLGKQPGSKVNPVKNDKALSSSGIKTCTNNQTILAKT